MSQASAIIAALFGAFLINVVSKGELGIYLGFFGVGGNSANPGQAADAAASGSSSPIIPLASAVLSGAKAASDSNGLQTFFPSIGDAQGISDSADDFAG